MQKHFYTYLLTSQKNGTLYAGHTDNISRRVYDHKEGRGAAFTKKYGVTRLVWYELHQTREDAKAREYQIKAWKRAWKIRLIEESNPEWRDLYLELNR
ncbi:MAG: GIY-YIG nuclease family protein [Pseudomonadota bacterium]